MGFFTPSQCLYKVIDSGVLRVSSIMCMDHGSFAPIDWVDVRLKDDTLLNGNLFEKINVDASTWTINDEHV